MLDLVMMAALASAGPSTASSVTVALPASGVYATEMSEARRLMLGGELSRSYITFDHGGATQVVPWRQAGHGADPTLFVPALAELDVHEVDLGASEVTPLQTYTAFAARMSAAGFAGVTNEGTDADGRVLARIPGASNLQLPPVVDTLDNNLRGMYGLQRDNWGAGAGTVTLNSNGGTNSTVITHLPPLSTDADIPAGRAARIVGAYCWGHGGYQPLLGAGYGPSYSVDPGDITMAGEGIVPDPLTGNAYGRVVFSQPIAITTDTQLWVMARAADGTETSGGRFRAHGQTVVGSGDLGVGQLTISNNAAAFANTDTFGAVYNPFHGTNSNYGIYMSMGLLIEVADANGNFHALGAQTYAVGDHNPDPLHGTQELVGPGILNTETTHHRQRVPNLPGDFMVTQIRRAIGTAPATEDCSAVLYGPWTDLTVPATVLPPMIADLGPVGLAGNPNVYTTLTLATPVDISGCTGSHVSLGFNYASLSGIDIVGLVLPAYIDASSGDNSYTNCWHDRRNVWHDDITGASSWALSSAVSEYQTNSGTGNTMPTASLSDPWLITFDGSDGTTPIAIALDRYVVDRSTSQLAVAA